ncbi:MAG: sugar ABC transporter substrate-binding protein [Rectinemataceae bacterium]|jgi:ribose transport system substrate-binding protein
MGKRIAFIALICMMLLPVGSAWSQQMKFGFSVATMDNPYFIEVAKGFTDKCKQLGVTAVISDAKYDAATQNDQFENYIAMGCKAMGACPVDQRGLQAVTQKAIDKGMIVVSEAQKIDNASGHIIVDDYGYGVVNGTNAAKWINNKLGGKAEVLLITLDHVEAVKLRGDGIEDTIKKLCPNAVIVARQYAESMERAMNIADTVLTAHPKVQVIACVNDQLALGALAAIQSKGIKDKNFYVGGADYTAEAQAKMKLPGSYFRVTVDIGPRQAGMDVAQMMYDYIKNGSKGETKFFTMTSHWQDGCGITEKTPATK